MAASGFLPKSKPVVNILTVRTEGLTRFCRYRHGITRGIAVINAVAAIPMDSLGRKNLLSLSQGLSVRRAPMRYHMKVDQ